MTDRTTDGEQTPDEPGPREREILQARRDSMQRLADAGIAPFALTFEPDSNTADVRAAHPELDPGTETGTTVTLAGRVVQRRDFGKLAFLVLRDRTGDLQVMCTAADLDEPSATVLAETDLGDIVGATGVVGTSRKANSRSGPRN